MFASDYPRYRRLISYNQMMFRFWVWDVNRFVQADAMLAERAQYRPDNATVASKPGQEAILEEDLFQQRKEKLAGL